MNKLQYLRRATDMFVELTSASGLYPRGHIAYDCGGISQLVHRLAQKTGMTGVRRTAGMADLRSNHPAERNVENPDEHVWLTVDGKVFDPKAWALRHNQWHPLISKHQAYSTSAAMDLYRDLETASQDEAEALVDEVVARLGTGHSNGPKSSRIHQAGLGTLATDVNKALKR